MKCHSCFKDVVTGRTRCKKHLRLLKEKQATYVQTKKAMGLCPFCGTRKPKDDRIVCETCLTYNRVKQFGRTERVYKRYKKRQNDNIK